MESNKADTYRLQKISEIQQEILRERAKRDVTCKNYQKGVKAAEALGGVLTLTSSGLGALGVTFLSTAVQWRLTPPTWNGRTNPPTLADLYKRDSEVTHNCKLIYISIVHYKSYYKQQLK